VIGRLEIGEWITREGEPHTSCDVWADDVVNLSPREEGAGSGEPDNGFTERAASPPGARSALKCQFAPGGAGPRRRNSRICPCDSARAARSRAGSLFPGRPLRAVGSDSGF
jgi:hypothetical protein